MSAAQNARTPVVASTAQIAADAHPYANLAAVRLCSVACTLIAQHRLLLPPALPHNTRSSRPNTRSSRPSSRPMSPGIPNPKPY